MRYSSIALMALAAGGAWACAPSRAARAIEPPVVAPPSPAAPSPAPPPPVVAATPVAQSPAEAFAASVKPVLATRCAPCHNPGGKMYERMPFDDPDLVRSHAEGIRKRLKGPDLEALDGWLSASSK